jgi:hypothetical protein
VIHWLAFGPSAEAAKDLEHSVAAFQTLRTPVPSTPSSIRAVMSRDEEYNQGFDADSGVAEPKEARVRSKEPSGST